MKKGLRKYQYGGTVDPSQDENEGQQGHYANASSSVQPSGSAQHRRPAAGYGALNLSDSARQTIGNAARAGLNRALPAFRATQAALQSARENPDVQEELDLGWKKGGRVKVGLRQMNKRAAMFGAPKVKRSRKRGYQFGGSVNADPNVVSPQDTKIEPDKDVYSGLRGYAAGGPVDDEEDKDKFEIGRVQYGGETLPQPPAPAYVESAADRPTGLRVGEVKINTPDELAAQSAPKREPLPDISGEAAPETGPPPEWSTPTLRGSYFTNAEKAAEAEKAKPSGYAQRQPDVGDVGPQRPGLRSFGQGVWETEKGKYANVDAEGRPLGAGEPDVGTQRVSTYKSTYTQDKARLDAAIDARLASGDQSDLEMANQLAVTPEQKAKVNAAYRKRVLTQQAGLGNREARAELRHMRAKEIAGLRGAPTALQIADYNLRVGQAQRAEQRAANEEKRAQTTEERAARNENRKVNEDMLNRTYGAEKGSKEMIANFQKSLNATLPGLVGDPMATLTPQQFGALMGLHEIMMRQRPGMITGLVKGEPSRNLFDYIPEATDTGFWSRYYKTPGGNLSPGDIGRKDLQDLIARFAAAKGLRT